MSTYTIPICPSGNKNINPGSEWKKDDLPDTDSGEDVIDVYLQPEGCELFGNHLEVKLENKESPYITCKDQTEFTWEQVVTSSGHVTNTWWFSAIWKGPDACICGKSGAYLVGNISVNTMEFVLNWEDGGGINWFPKRQSLPAPGEKLMVYLAVPYDGAATEFPAGLSNVSECVPPGDSYPSHVMGSWMSSGDGYMLKPAGHTYFETPTWTGGIIEKFYTDETGWIEEDNACPSMYDAIPDDSLKYGVRVRGEVIEVLPSDFAGYAIGNFVLLRKLNVAYFEPYNSTILEDDLPELRIVPWRYPS
mgnify:CR=1 FL=1